MRNPTENVSKGNQKAKKNNMLKSSSGLDEERNSHDGNSQSSPLDHSRSLSLSLSLLPSVLPVAVSFFASLYQLLKAPFGQVQNNHTLRKKERRKYKEEARSPLHVCCNHIMTD